MVSSAMQRARQSLMGRSVTVHAFPPPISFAERRSILQVLQQHGPVEVFKLIPVSINY